MTLEAPSRLRQGSFLPDLRRERFERALMQMVGGDFEDTVFKKLRRLGFLAPDERIELNLRQEANSGSINLFLGILKNGWASIDYIPPWREIHRAPQIISRNPKRNPVCYFDASSIYHLFSGRIGIYSRRNFQREEILHDENGYDDRWDFSTVSGVTAHRLLTWERPAYVLTTVPDTAYVSLAQLNLPL